MDGYLARAIHLHRSGRSRESLDVLDSIDTVSIPVSDAARLKAVIYRQMNAADITTPGK